MGLNAPLLDSSRARDELGWTPRRTGLEALAEALDGIREGATAPTPPLRERSRAEEIATRVGGREAP
jgi:hypothetical protein